MPTTASPSRSSSTRCRPPLARKRRAPPATIVTAALLHDLGHLLNDQGETPTLRGVDDVHQYRRAAVPARPLRRRRALADQAARGRQALPVRDARRVLRRTLRGLEAQPRAAGRRIHAGAGRRVHRAAARTACRRRAPVGRSRQDRRRADPAARALRPGHGSSAAHVVADGTDSLGVTLAVLGAGLLHAGWNALIKSASGGDALLDTATIIGGSTLCSLVALPFLPFRSPRRGRWPPPRS